MRTKYFQRQITVIVIGIFLIALLLRLAIAIHSKQNPVKDALGYDIYAMNLLAGNGLIDGQGKLTSWRGPVYPLFLASVYYFFGHSYLAVRVIQAVLGALTCGIIYLIAKKTFNEVIGLISALISCFYLPFIKLTEYLLAENLFTFLFALATLFLLRQINQEKDFKNLICSGIILGLATLTRSITLLFPFFILLFMGKRLALQKDVPKKCFIAGLIFIFSFLLPIAPWTIRNWKVHHKFVPGVTMTGLILYTSFHPKEGKIFGFNARDEITKEAESLTTETERNDFLVKHTLRYIKDNPTRLFRLEILKMLYFWSPFDWSILGGGVYNFAYGFILPFFILGIFTSFRDFKELMSIYLPIVYTLLFALVTFGIPRFRLPIEPYIIIFVSVGIDKFLRHFPKKTFPFLLMASLLLINLAFYFNSSQLKLFVKSILENLNIW